MTQKQRLIFVYNADSGLFDRLTDFAHKIVSPQTYDCNLCALTYGNLTMQKEWKEYLLTLGRPIEFLHRDQFAKTHPEAPQEFPAVFHFLENHLVRLLSPEQLNGLHNLDELKNLLSSSL